MLSSYYALLLFALTSSVVAPPPPPQPELAFGLAWQKLQGNDLLEDGPGWPMHCWYRLKLVEPQVKPIWPNDANLDHFMCFDDPVSRVTYLKLERVEKNGQFHLHEYLKIRESGVNDLSIPLEGYWGRGPPTDKLNAFSDGTVRPVITFDEAIEIRLIWNNKRQLEREVRFLRYEDVMVVDFYSAALTVYELTKGWQVLQDNEDPRLLEISPNPYRWYRLKSVVDEGYPTWPEDAGLERVIQLRIENHRVSGLSLHQLRRVATADGRELHLVTNAGYEFVRTCHFNDMNMVLDGFWGRANKLNPWIKGQIWGGTKNTFSRA
ncbi:hypothetical protein AX14_004684 [Amanita brunnescens Koide BX004]|nr:hypothetical protein AX14_004684 [Amanita brunnescens Koide BX004]